MPRGRRRSTRATIGHMLPDVVLDACTRRCRSRVPAEGTSNLWNLKLERRARHDRRSGRARPRALHGDDLPFRRRRGAAGRDGLSATAFPSGVRNVPVEITETIAPS